jgi:hypothetical protein
MNRTIGRWWTAILLTLLIAAPASAQNEQFILVLTYRTGVYAVSGAPYADGKVDYYRLINKRDGGINGIKIVFQECETGYATDRGLECYERLKGNGLTGAAFVVPSSTSVTFVLTEKANTDKIPLLTPGIRTGRVEKWRSVHVEFSATRDLLVGCRYCDPTYRERNRWDRQA